MRKILILSTLVVVLSGCGLKSSSDFTSLYNDHVHANIVALSDFGKALGLYKQEQSVGTFRAAVNVPVLMSGALSFEHDAKVNGRDADLSLKNIRLAYESMMGSGLLSLEKFGLISKESDVYFFFNELKDENLLPEDVRNMLSTYAGTWLSWTREDMRKSLSGASEEEILSNTIVENLSRMTLVDIEKYLKKYPFFKETADLGMSGSMHVFAVDVDRVAILSLMKEVTEDLAGTGISADDQAEIESTLASLIFSGTLAFDPKNPRITETHLNISESGSTQIGTLDARMDENLAQIRIGSSNNTSASFVFEKKGNRSELQLIVSEGGVDMGKLSGYIEKDGGKFKELSLDVTAQGMTVGLKHTLKEGGIFEGNLQLPIGNITWNGVIESKKVTALTLKGTMPMGSLSMELAPKDGNIVGPLVVKEGSNELLRANVTLLIDEGKFGLGLDVLNPESNDLQAHVDMDITAKSSPFTSSIGAPSPSKPLQGLLDELEKFAPTNSFVPVDDMNEMGDASDFQIPDTESMETSGMDIVQ